MTAAERAGTMACPYVTVFSVCPASPIQSAYYYIVRSQRFPLQQDGYEYVPRSEYPSTGIMSFPVLIDEWTDRCNLVIFFWQSATLIALQMLENSHRALARSARAGFCSVDH